MVYLFPVITVKIMLLISYESENWILFAFTADKAPSFQYHGVLIREGFQTWTISLLWNARELLTKNVQQITSLQRRGHKLENNIKTYFGEEIFESLDRSNWLTLEEYFCEYKTNIAFLVDVSEDEASDPLQKASKYIPVHRASHSISPAPSLGRNEVF